MWGSITVASRVVEKIYNFVFTGAGWGVPVNTGAHYEQACSAFLATTIREQTAIEYGLIAAGISIAIIAVVNGLGTQLNATFTSVSTQLK